jgi:hypothetical protein
LLRTPAPWNEMFLLLLELFHRASIAWVEVVRIWGMPRYNSLLVGIWEKRSDIMLLCLANLYVCSPTLVANVLAYRMRIGLGVKSPSGNRCPVLGVRSRMSAIKRDAAYNWRQVLSARQGPRAFCPRGVIARMAMPQRPALQGPPGSHDVLEMKGLSRELRKS